ncbi:MAG: hypothetical protein QE271_04040 [Bacteriovoracaceae bacterium]|nr:hypothetical protein [Bacteriovoracaceae bacterium]
MSSITICFMPHRASADVTGMNVKCKYLFLEFYPLILKLDELSIKISKLLKRDYPGSSLRKPEIAQTKHFVKRMTLLKKPHLINLLMDISEIHFNDPEFAQKVASGDLILEFSKEKVWRFITDLEIKIKDYELRPYYVGSLKPVFEGNENIYSPADFVTENQGGIVHNVVDFEDWKEIEEGAYKSEQVSLQTWVYLISKLNVIPYSSGTLRAHDFYHLIDFYLHPENLAHWKKFYHYLQQLIEDLELKKIEYSEKLFLGLADMVSEAIVFPNQKSMDLWKRNITIPFEKFKNDVLDSGNFYEYIEGYGGDFHDNRNYDLNSGDKGINADHAYDQYLSFKNNNEVEKSNEVAKIIYQAFMFAAKNGVSYEQMIYDIVDVARQGGLPLNSDTITRKYFDILGANDIKKRLDPLYNALELINQK